jgi:DNA-binding CsgD family transcriptional regulator/tetratricopeptide (TPR) repeat protein
MKPQVVGRDAELAVLARAVSGGHGRIILLRGEAGIGKSRLADHTLANARVQGLTVLHGQAHPLHAGLAYAPVVEAIRPHIGSLRDYDGLAHLSRLLADPRLPAAPPAGAPELDRTRMFDAVATLVERLAPAVFFIDDLHWADRGTVELVHYLGHAATEQQVLVLAAYRPGDAGTPLDDLAITVRRNDPGAELTLTPLTDDAVAQVAGELLGAPPEAEFLENVTQRAKGVPLFVTALVQGGYRAEAVLPTIVRDVVLGRLQQLDEAERRLIEVVAVAGEAGTDDVLRAVSDDAEALKNLIVKGLVTERGSGRDLAYRVAHPLYAEVAYAEMTFGERRKLHAAVLTAVEKADPHDVLTLAPHYREAGSLADPQRAVEVMAEAGWRALSVRATDEAIKYLEAAVDQATPEDSPMLLDGVGRAYMSIGELDKATAAWTKGVQLAEQLGQDDARTTLRFRLAMLESERQDSELANDRLWAELQVVNTDSAEVWIQRFIYTLRHGGLDEARKVTMSMTDTVSDTHPAAMQAVAHFGRAVKHLIDLEFMPAMAEAGAAVAQALRCQAETPFYAQYFRLFLSVMYALNGEIAKAHECAQQAQQAGALVELPSVRSFEYYALSFAQYLAGDLDAAIATIDVGVTVAKESAMPRSITRTLALRALLKAEQGQFSEAMSTLAEAKKTYWAPDQSLLEIVTLAGAAITVYLGEPLPVAMIDASATYGDPCATIIRLLYTGLAGINAGDAERVTNCANALRGFKQQAGLMTAFGDRLEGLLTRDADLLAGTADRLEAMGARLFAAQIRLEWSELTNSPEPLPQVLEFFEQAGAAHWANRARQHARALGVHVRALRRTGPLTNREAEVVRLLGDGLSNADIAARLFVSGRTVETHLRNSYAKLGLSTRIALAKWAGENLG